jgi:hydrogenase expression/formation protein HypC
MCLGIPGRVKATYREHDVLMGKVEFGGISRKVCLEHVPDAMVGDFVLVHVGFALSRIDETEARRVFEFLERMDQLDELSLPAIPEGLRPSVPKREHDVASTRHTHPNVEADRGELT